MRRVVASALVVAMLVGLGGCYAGPPPVTDSNGRQCATRQIQVVPIAHQLDEVIEYTFVASVLGEDCNLVGMHGPEMVVNVIMRQIDANGRDATVGASIANQVVDSPYAYTWGMDRGYVHALQGDAGIVMTAEQIDEWGAEFIECYWLRNGRPFPAAAEKYIVARAIEPIRPGVETVVECYGSIPPD